jgi:L-lactate dehydrogenase complex protein LldF
MTSGSTAAFEQRVAQALDDRVLQKTIRKRQDGRRDLQHRSAGELSDWDAWTSAVEAVSTHTLDHLDYYLAQFVDNLEARGGHVYFASTAGEATDYVSQLAQDRNVGLVVKSKSMLTEEIGLTVALEKTGATVLETDLGEFIIQLAHETPFHILGPASHKTLEEIRDLFEELSGEELPCAVPDLVAFARRYLREKFLAADMGVSGCNFAVASEGSIVLVTNEGNGRLCTSLPRIHVVIMGMERLVPTLESLEPALTVLPRSSQGVRSTAYVTVITGPRASEDEDGPEELHVVIVDNGRSRILAGRYRKVLSCMRCGACLDHCPVYRNIGGHAYGPVYSGPIGAVLNTLLGGIDAYPHLPFASSLCYACSDVCPARIPLADYLLSLRCDAHAAGLSEPAWRIGFRGYAEATLRPRFWGAGLRLAEICSRPWQRHQAIHKGPGLLANWTASRDLPALARQSFRESWRRASESDDWED